jgi:hypothetical protein
LAQKAKGSPEAAFLGVSLRPDQLNPDGMEKASLARKLDGLDVLGLEALGSAYDVELYALTFLKAAEAVGANRGEVNENIFVVALASDEAETLCVVEPLDCALFHGDVFPLKMKFADIGARQNAGRTSKPCRTNPLSNELDLP